MTGVRAGGRAPLASWPWLVAGVVLLAGGFWMARRATAPELVAFFQHVVNGVALGSIYSLIAIGYTMVYGILQLINFAHSDVFMVGIYAGFYFANWTGVARAPTLAGTLATIGFAMACCGALGFAIERLAYRPLRQAPRINSLITAIGVSLFLENLGQLVFGPNPQAFPEIIPGWDEPILLGGVSIDQTQVLALGTGLALMVVLQFVVYRTRIGLGMRAVSFNPDVAGLMGVPIDRVISATFVIGSVMAAAAGILVGLAYTRFDPVTTPLTWGLKAFVAAVLGGIGNIPGAMLGGILMGLAEEMVVGYWSSSYKDALAFAILILMLLIRPAGLLGTMRQEKV